MDNILSGCDSAEATQPVAAELRTNLLEPFIIAAGLTLGEMAGTTLEVRTVYQRSQPRTLGDISAVLGLMGASEGSLVLSFSEETARSLAGRVLADMASPPDADLVRDCIGELANVIAGQTKAQLVGTPYHFVFSTPTVVAGPHHEVRTKSGLSCLVVVFSCDLGEFALQVCLNLEEQAASAMMS